MIRWVPPKSIRELDLTQMIEGVSSFSFKTFPYSILGGMPKNLVNFSFNVQPIITVSAHLLRRRSNKSKGF